MRFFEDDGVLETCVHRQSDVVALSRNDGDSHPEELAEPVCTRADGQDHLVERERSFGCCDGVDAAVVMTHRRDRRVLYEGDPASPQRVDQRIDEDAWIDRAIVRHDVAGLHVIGERWHDAA